MEGPAFRDGPDGKPVTSRFVFVPVRAAHDWRKATRLRREELLIAEWPSGADEPIDYWLTNLPADTEPERRGAPGLWFHATACRRTRDDRAAAPASPDCRHAVGVESVAIARFENSAAQPSQADGGVHRRFPALS